MLRTGGGGIVQDARSYGPGSPGAAALDRLELLATAAATSAALDAGVLRTLLDGGARTPAALADELVLDAEILERVLEVLSGTGLARRSDGGARFRAGPALEALGEADSPLARMELAVWGHVPEALRTGTPLPLSGPSDDRERTYAGIADDLARMSGTAARRLAASLDLSGGSVLDVGCGAGVWSLALAGRNPGVRVVGVDLPTVLESFLERARGLGLEDRVEARPGDMHRLELEPGSYELAIVANVLRLEPSERARSLLQKVGRAVGPNGALLVIDAFPGSSPRGRRLHAAYRLHLGLRNATGDTHGAERVEGWMREDGFPRIEPVDLGTEGLMRGILARREEGLVQRPLRETGRHKARGGAAQPRKADEE